MNIHDVILRPLVTEKSNIAREESHVVTFAVAPSANKHEIRRATEALFSVEVLEVRRADLGKQRLPVPGDTRDQRAPRHESACVPATRHPRPDPRGALAHDLGRGGIVGEVPEHRPHESEVRQRRALAQ